MFDTLTRMGAAGAVGDYEIEKSLIFNSTDSTRLQRTFGSNSSDTTKTLSFWVKRGQIGGTQTLFSTTSDGYIESRLDFLSDGTLQFNDRDAGSGTSDIIKRTNKRYKDIASWYHIVLIIDTTNGTAADRVRLYTNGVRDTSLLDDNTPAQNYAVSFHRSSVTNFIGSNNTNQYCDVYLAEIHFLDGTIKEPDKFGETNADTGQWVPIEYTEGGYGNNGFHLKFTDNSNTTATTLGADSTGTGHNWTCDNFATADAVIDTPSNNFCTFNAAVQNINLTFRQGLTRVDLGDAHKTAYTTFGVNSGKWYWEGLAVAGSNDKHVIGVSDVRNSGNKQLQYTNYLLGQTTNTNAQGDAVSVYYDDFWKNGSTFDTGAIADNLTNGEIVGIAMDLDNHKVWFSHKGVWANGSATNSTTFDASNHDTTLTTGETYQPAFSGETSNWQANFGQDGTFAGALTAQGNKDSEGIGDFYYPVPSGFKALCSKNLPEPTILKGTTYFNSVEYTGNDADGHAITGVGFQPDLVWIKDRGDTNHHRVYDSVRGVNAALLTSATNTEDQYATYGQFESFDTDGFTVGIGTGNSSQRGEATNSAELHVAWCWKEAAAAGMDIISYTGTGSNPQTRAHSLGVAPEMIIVKSRSGTDGDEHWAVYHHRNQTTTASSAQYWARLNTNGAFEDLAMWNDTAPTSSVFTTQNHAISNANTKTFIAYAFAGVEGYSKFGRYIGTGQQDGPFIYTGFQPQFLLVKKVASAYWHIHDNIRNKFNPRNAPLYPNATPADEYYNLANAASLVVDFHANGFKPWTTHGEYNADGEPYIYAAFAEYPFKYSNAI